MFLFILIFLIVASTFYFVVRFLKNKTKRRRLTTVYYPPEPLPAPAPAPSGIPEKQLKYEEAIRKIFIIMGTNSTGAYVFYDVVPDIKDEDKVKGTGTAILSTDFGLSWDYQTETLTLFSPKDEQLKTLTKETVFAYWKGATPPATISFPLSAPPPYTKPTDYRNPTPPYDYVGVYATDNKSITVSFSEVNFLTENVYISFNTLE